MLTQTKVKRKNTFTRDMLSLIKCGSFVIESISQHESIFNIILSERWCKVVRKIQGFIG